LYFIPAYAKILTEEENLDTIFDASSVTGGEFMTDILEEVDKVSHHDNPIRIRNVVTYTVELLSLLLGAFRTIVAKLSRMFQGLDQKYSLQLMLAIFCALAGGLAPILAKIVLAKCSQILIIPQGMLASFLISLVAITCIFFIAYPLCPAIKTDTHNLPQRRVRLTRFNPLKQEIRVYSRLIGSDKGLAILSPILGSILGPYLFFGALLFIPAHVFNVIWVSGAYIVATVLSFKLLKENMTLRKIGGSFIVILGVVLALAWAGSVDKTNMIVNIASMLKSLFNPGGLLAVLAALCYGSQRVVSKKLIRRQSPEERTQVGLMLLRLGYLLGTLVSAIIVTIILILIPSEVILNQNMVDLARISAITAFAFLGRWWSQYRVQQTPFEQSKMEPILATSVVFSILLTYGWNLLKGVGLMVKYDWPLWLAAAAVIVGVFIASSKTREGPPLGLHGSQ